jgi:hypothetical protein
MAVAIVAGTSFVVFAEADDLSDAPPRQTLEEAQNLVRQSTAMGPS